MCPSVVDYFCLPQKRLPFLTTLTLFHLPLFIILGWLVASKECERPWHCFSLALQQSETSLGGPGSRKRAPLIMIGIVMIVDSYSTRHPSPPPPLSPLAPDNEPHSNPPPPPRLPRLLQWKHAGRAWSVLRQQWAGFSLDETWQHIRVAKIVPIIPYSNIGY